MTIFLLYLVKQLSSSQKVKDNIDWVVWLVDSFKSEKIIVTIKAKLSHDGELIDETFFSIFSIEATLLWKGFNCKLSMISNSLNLINWGKVTFSQFFERFEHFMESLSINFFGEAQYPRLDDMEKGRVEAKAFLLIIE